MTDSAGESNAKGYHFVIRVREEEEICEREISDVGNQTLSGNEKNEDELLASWIGTELPQKVPEPDPTCIFRVPKKLVRDNENVFVPQVVSIGPYHHGGKKYEAMEQIKLWYLQRLLDRKPTPDTSLVKFVKEIRSREEFLRNCYDQKFDLTSDKFVKMMVVDGCFIVQLMRGDTSTEDHDPVSRMVGAVINDMLLLENQLPWQVLDCLYNLTRTSSTEESVHIRIWDLFSEYYLQSRDDPTETGQIRHLLDHVRIFLVGSPAGNIRRYYQHWTPIPSVTHLEEIGVKFQETSLDKHQLDITFDWTNGVMKIPFLRIGANTESLLRNLIAYEQCSLRHHECPILSYAVLFNHLIKSTKDLDSLIQKRVIATKLSKEDTVCLFNRLCNDTERIYCFYSQLALRVNFYYRRRWLRRSLARIKRDYLYNPSSIWSVSNDSYRHADHIYSSCLLQAVTFQSINVRSPNDQKMNKTCVTAGKVIK